MQENAHDHRSTASRGCRATASAPEVCDAARAVLDAVGFPAEYIHGDIGWEFWTPEGEALPERTVELLQLHRLRVLRRHHVETRR